MQGGTGEVSSQGRTVQAERTHSCTDGSGGPARADRGRARRPARWTTLSTPAMRQPSEVETAPLPVPLVGELISADGDAERAQIAIPLGRYTLLREIGHGGMGTVFEAEQHEPKRRVAVKLMSSP